MRNYINDTKIFGATLQFVLRLEVGFFVANSFVAITFDTGFFLRRNASHHKMAFYGIKFRSTVVFLSL